MKHVLRDMPADLPVDYIGGDIVAPLIAQLNTQYKNKRTKFRHMDIIHDEFPKADLMICRDCMPHLSFDQARQMLDNFMTARSRFFSPPPTPMSPARRTPISRPAASG